MAILSDSDIGKLSEDTKAKLIKFAFDNLEQLTRSTGTPNGTELWHIVMEELEEE